MSEQARPIALIHNRYLEAGGEDVSVTAHAALLKAHGHAVVRFESSNEELTALGGLAKARTAIRNQNAIDQVRRFLQRERPMVAHFHNTFPLLSPAVYEAAQLEGIPVVQTLHNYRTICPNALLFRSGAPCEECVTTRSRWPAVVHSCYRDSRAATAVTAGMLLSHDLLGTWREAVNTYVALTEFAKAKFIAGGLPAARIVVSPGFLASDPGCGTHAGAYALFVGRLSPEKGVATLLDAWRALTRTDITLRIVGTGPVEASYDHAVPGVEWLGRVTGERVLALMRDAAFLVLPSECYESFPMTLVEAFATGLPVIASNHGAMAEVVTHGQSGLLFRPGDARDLGATIQRMLDQPQERALLGAAARREFEAKYSGAVAHERLMSVYALAAGAGVA